MSQQNQTQLSIVTICFNDLAGLQKTISSLSQQTTNQFEQIIVDGGSSDGSKEYLKDLKLPWSFKWISEKDKGIYDAMNKGASLASGEYVWYLNSADYVAAPDVVNFVLENLSSHQEADLFYGQLYFENKFGRRLVGQKTAPKEFFVDMPCLQPASIIRKNLILESPYRTDFRIISDWIFLRKFFELSVGSRSYQTYYLNKALAVFDMEGISSTNVWKILAEKIRFEGSLKNRCKLIFKSGLKYSVLSLLERFKLLQVVRRLRHSS